MNNKRPRTSGLGGAEYGTVSGQVAHSAKRYGRGQKKNLKQAWKRLKLDMKFSCGRWQSLTGKSFTGDPATPTAAQGTKLIGMQRVGAAPNSYACPVYAFNMTSMGLGTTAAGATTAGLPMYRLFLGSGGDYFWQVEVGINDGGAVDDAAWKYEDFNSKVASFSETFQHHYTSANFVFYGAKTRPVKFEVMQVKFNHNAGPERQYATGGTALKFDTNETGDEQLVRNGFWQSFLAARTNHPLRTSKNFSKKKCFTVKTKDVFTITNDASTNLDTNACCVIKKYTCKDNGYYTAIKGPQVNLNIIGEPATGTPVPYVDYDVNNTTQSLNAGFPSRSRDTWLLIVANTYDLPDGVGNNSITPSFDCVMRAKWSTTN